MVPEAGGLRSVSLGPHQSIAWVVPSLMVLGGNPFLASSSSWQLPAFRGLWLRSLHPPSHYLPLFHLQLPYCLPLIRIYVITLGIQLIYAFQDP